MNRALVHRAPRDNSNLWAADDAAALALAGWFDDVFGAVGPLINAIPVIGPIASGVLGTVGSIINKDDDDKDSGSSSAPRTATEVSPGVYVYKNKQVVLTRLSPTGNAFTDSKGRLYIVPNATQPSATGGIPTWAWVVGGAVLLVVALRK